MRQDTTVWDAIFRERGRVFTHPQEDMPQLAERLVREGAKTLLDLGCGTGRHVVFFAHHGLSVHGVDSSPEGLRQTEETLRASGLSAHLHLQDVYEPLLFPDEFFDAVISIQVIHHARLGKIRQLIGELRRVLKPGGSIFVSVARLRNQAQSFREIEPNTLVPLDGREAGLVHHFFTPDELRQVFDQFEVEDVHLDGTNHDCLLARKPMEGA